MYKHLNDGLLEMERAGVSNMNWEDVVFASPCFFVNQKRSNKKRLCVAYDLNKVTQDDIYPLPLMEVVLEQLKGKKYFSVIDLKSGYWQCPLSERARKYLATIISCGTFKWNVFPFGVKNATSYFQRTMNKILSEGLGQYYMAYIDDIVIYLDSFEGIWNT